MTDESSQHDDDTHEGKKQGEGEEDYDTELTTLITQLRDENAQLRRELDELREQYRGHHEQFHTVSEQHHESEPEERHWWFRSIGS